MGSIFSKEKAEHNSMTRTRFTEHSKQRNEISQGHPYSDILQSSWPSCEKVGSVLGAAESDSLKGSTIIVTGGNSGIGANTSMFFASRGATVILAARDESKAKQLIIETKEKYSSDVIMHFIPLNLASLSSIQSFATAFVNLSESRGFPPLDTLILNAGIFRMGAGEIKYAPNTNMELTFAINHMGGFSLTQLLLPHLRAAAKQNLSRAARVVVLSSESHNGPLASDKPEDLNSLKEDVIYCSNGYGSVGGLNAYGSSKLCNVLFASKLHQREADANTGVVACSLHPGNMIGGTGLTRNSNFLVRGLFSLVGNFTKSVDQGAATTVYCSLIPPSSLRGQYFDNCRVAPKNDLAITTFSFPNGKDKNEVVQRNNLAEDVLWISKYYFNITGKKVCVFIVVGGQIENALSSVYNKN